MSRVSLAARVRPPAERTIRVRHRMLQTPVVRFEHAKTGQAVTVAGVVHIARAGYYRQLGIMLTNLEAAGALVFYEGISHAAETGWSAVGQADRDTWNSMQTGGKELTQAACRYLGWVRQGEALAYSASWRNVDMSVREFVQRKGAQDMLDAQEAVTDMLGDRAGDQRDALMGVGAGLLMRLHSLDRYQLVMRWAATAYPGFSQLVVDERNDRALACLPPDRDSVLIWGYGHLPGLAAGLLRAGYRRQASAWLNAGRLPPLPVSARVVWAALRADQGSEASEGSEDSGDSAGSSGM
jgi:hypothetical protein